MGYDLRRGLHDLGDQPPQGGTPLDPGRVLGRVRRARAARAAAVGVTSAAAVLGLTLVVQALPLTDDDPSPGPAATSEPAPSPTPTATAQPSPTPSVTPSPTAEVPAPAAVLPLVAVTAQGEVVTLDPATGERLATLHTGIDVGDAMVDVTMDHARGVVYVAQRPADGQSKGEILRIPVGGGAAELLLARAWSPLLSPDGTFLVAHAVDPTTNASSLAIVDVESGDVRYLPQVDDYAGRWLRPYSWSPDGATLYLSIGAEESSGLRTLPVDATSLDEAGGISPSAGEQWETTVPLGPDLLAVAVRGEGWEPATDEFGLRLVDRASGAPVDEIDGARGRWARDLVATSDGGLVVLVGTWSAPTPELTYDGLYRWDGAEGLVLLAEGIVAVGG
ncbi:hypothetical protein [Cellulomonas sp. NS3]|uniref:hypothetical protein n=1 Tax=Cellulomonas sp. NS3 TaxID=2973977 RepID=UPI0021624574|nr:hypothetical protein [Cellulomonas sp. NS3]